MLRKVRRGRQWTTFLKKRWGDRRRSERMNRSDADAMNTSPTQTLLSLLGTALVPLAGLLHLFSYSYTAIASSM